jgi:putative aminopeptidase FrvX
VGHGAAAGFPPDLAELVTVDMAVVAPKQTSDEFSVTICAKDGAGPVPPGPAPPAGAAGGRRRCSYRTDVYPYYGSDGEAYWRAGGNVAVGLIGPGVDASHHYERTHREALEHSARLIAAYLLDPGK